MDHAPRELWVKLAVGGGTISYRQDPREGGFDDGRAVYRYHLEPPEVDETMLIDVLLLCTECQQPIKARINMPQWIRVEWIGPSGECQRCYNEKKKGRNVTSRLS